MAAPTELLGQVDLFRDLDRRELQDVAGAMKEYTFPAGREIVTQGTDGVGFFVIAQGTARVTVDGGDIRTLGPGDHFGEIALIAEAPRTATVQAESELTAWGMTAWGLPPDRRAERDDRLEAPAGPRPHDERTLAGPDGDDPLERTRSGLHRSR